MLFPFSQWPQWEILRDLEVWDHPCDEFHRLLYKREKARKLGSQMRFTAAKTCKDHWRSADSRFGMVWSALSSLCISGLWVGLDSAWKFCCRLGLIANSKAYWEGMQPATPWELAQSMKRYWEIHCLQCFSARIPTAMSTTCWTPRSYDVFTQNK